MTKQTSSLLFALVLATGLSACGEDPYSGDSRLVDASPDEAGTDTTTATTSSTSSTTVTNTKTDTKTSTSSDTSTVTTSQTTPSTNTRTGTTGPVTATTTAIVTVTVTNTSTVDAGVPDAPAGDPSRRDIYISVAAYRALDLVFMIDNTPSMAPKVAKLNAQFPKLMAALKDPIDGTLPDLRLAIIDSDLGTGGAYTNGSCAVRTLPDGTQSAFGDLGRFQMLRSPTSCTFDDGAQFLQHKAGQPVNYTGDINSVFACLASNLGTMGCGMESQLQAFEFALVAQGVGNEEQQRAFVRPNAHLGLVFLTDEDDCSAAPNDGLYGDFPDLRGEAASLRCATRAHMCNGQNLASSGPGYPTSASFTAPLSACQARVGDECSDNVDTSKPTTCNPLKSVTQLAAELKSLKADPESQVFVAGIFGWPLSDAEMATAEYKIAPIPNPNTADIQHPTVYNPWPVCYDPDHLPTRPDPATGYDAEAAGWGAAPGLRESAFVDQFGDSGTKLSICARDYSDSMKKIGDGMARKLQNLCIEDKLLDTDANTAGVQAECTAVLQLQRQDPTDPTKAIYVDSGAPMPQCPAGSTDGAVSETCWQLITDTLRCPTTGQVVAGVLRPAAEIVSQRQLEPGTRIHLNCHVCTAGSTEPGCNY